VNVLELRHALLPVFSDASATLKVI
jgi:hypothetical protein